jgi:heme-degrading monooxygenase HmoA
MPISLDGRRLRDVTPTRQGDVGAHRPVLEHAVLDVVPGEESRFEAALDEALPLIAASQGFRALQVQHSVEQPSRYLLLVEWERLEDRTEGFRRSPEYDRWRRLLHHFYDPFPVVAHYEPVVRVPGA